MKESTTYDIIIIGLSKIESDILSCIFKSAGNNSGVEFRLVSGKHSENANFAIVNSDNPQVVRKWRVWNARSKPIYSIYAFQKKPPVNAQSTIAKPFNPDSVIACLQQAVYKAYGEVPHFEISEHSENTNSQQLQTMRNNTRHSSVSALVVDDCATILKSMELQLNLLEIKSDCVSSGEEALLNISRKRYDLIFLDIVLPGVDGYEVCKIIKQNPLQSNTPVCMLTGKSNMFNVVRGKLAGCDKYITKPAKSQELSDAILKMLNITSFNQLKSA